MISERTRAIVELTGLAAVVVSLLVVAYEVRQSNRIAQATTTYEIARDVNDFNVLGYSDPGFADFLTKLRDPQAAMSPADRLRARLLANRFINIWTVQEKAFENGLLTRDQFEATKRDVVDVMAAFPGLMPHWPLVLESQPGLKDSKVLTPLVESMP
jgi:hypothetical protein